MKTLGEQLSRRQIAAFGVGAAAAVLGQPALAQFDSTPPVVAPPAAGDVGEETVAGVAARLNYDATAIFSFVRDEIAYEPYAGVLRGASGTLSARAGNSADQAELLGALLAASRITYRYASGALDAAQQEFLRSATSRSRESVQDAWDRAAVAAAPEAPQSSSPENLESLREDGTTLLTEIGREADDLVAAIASALEGAGVALPEPALDLLPDFEISRHSWVQVADGPSWTDLDPILSSAVVPQPTATMTMDDWPPEWHHQVVFAIEGEHLTQGILSRRQASSLTANSRALAGVPVVLGMTSPDALAGIGFAITEAISGQVSAVPWLLANETTAIASTPLAFTIAADSAGSAFGGEGLPDDECVGIWLVTTITSPDAPSRRIERALLDRVPAEDRLAGNIDPLKIAPVPIGANGEDPDIMTRLTLLHTELARTPPVAAIRRAEADPNLGALGAVGPMLTTLRDAVGGGVEIERDAWSYPSAPCITAVTIDPGVAGDPDLPALLRTDLISHQRSVVRVDGGDAGNTVHPLLRSGVLDAMSETLLLNPPERDGLEIPATGPSITRIFAAAADTGVPIRAVQVGADLGAIDLTPEARFHIEAALNDGNVVVVPEQPVDIDGRAAIGWWIVDPLTGRTRDQLADGTGGASARIGHAGPLLALSPLPEYGVLIDTINAVLERRLLCVMGALVVRNVFLAILALIAARPRLSEDATIVIAIGGASAGGLGSGLLATCG